MSPPSRNAPSEMPGKEKVQITDHLILSFLLKLQLKHHLHLQSAAGIAVWSREPWIAETPLIQAIAVPPAVTVTCWPNVKVLHTPLNI